MIFDATLCVISVRFECFGWECSVRAFLLNLFSDRCNGAIVALKRNRSGEGDRLHV